jgi:hypothetical protein
MLKRSLLILLAGAFVAATLPVSGADAPDSNSGKPAQHSKPNTKKKTAKKKTTKKKNKPAAKPAPKAS